MNAHHVWWVGEIVSNCYLAKGFVGLLQVILQQLNCQVKNIFCPFNDCTWPFGSDDGGTQVFFLIWEWEHLHSNDKKEWPENVIDTIYIPSAWPFLTETTMPVSRAMMVNPCATILPLIIFCKNKYLLNYDHVLNATWLPSLSFLPNLNSPFTRKKVVAPQPKEYPRHFPLL